MKKQGILGVAAILMAGVMWGHSGFFVHILSGYGVTGMGVSIMRLLFTLVIMALFILFLDRSLYRIDPRCLPYFIITGMIGMVGSSLFYFYSIEMTSMSVAVVLMYTSPTIVMLLSLYLFKDKLTPQRIVCCFLAFAGAALSSGIFSGNLRSSVLGIVFGCLAGFSYALYSVGSGLALRRGCNPISISLYSFAFASATILTVAAIRGEMVGLVRAVGAKPVIVPIAIAQAVMTCLVPYVLYTLGIKYTSPAKASVMSTIEIVVASLVGFVRFGEKIDVFGYVGIALVILSIVILNINHKEKQKSA